VIKINKKKKFDVKIKFTNSVLGMKACDPYVFLNHQVERSRKAIRKWSKSQKPTKDNVNFLDAEQIKDSQVKKELDAFKITCESMLGEKIPKDIWQDALNGELGKNTILYSMLSSQRGSTIFLKDVKGFPYMEPYALKGAMKEYVGIVCERTERKRGKLFYRLDYSVQMFNRHLFISSLDGGNKIYFWENENCKGKKKSIEMEGKETSWLERKLTAKNAQGTTTALAKSEWISEGGYMQFRLETFLLDMTKENLEQMLGVGDSYGLAQWRNSGRGSFEVIEVKERR